MVPNTNQKLAVLIDTDNAQASVIPELLAKSGGKNEPATL